VPLNILVKKENGMIVIIKPREIKRTHILLTEVDVPGISHAIVNEFTPEGQKLLEGK
jgi:hypothetical protein